MKKVLYVVEDTKSVQFRYRVKNVAEALKGRDYEVEWVVKTELDRVKLDEFDLVVILRQTDKDGVISRFIDLVHSVSKKVLFDLDDLIFDYRDVMLLMRTTNSKNVAYWMGYFWGIRRVARKVDGFICTNGFLAKKLKRSFGKRVKVIRNSLNAAQVEISGRFVEKKIARRIAESGFSIGYFSGSPTHKKDFVMVEPELVHFLKIHKDAKLKMVGYMEFSKRMKRLVNTGRVEMVKPVDYLRLQGLMAKVDVNIAPLIINDFTNCKSELKFFEAGAVETTTIASPTYAFLKAIENGKNGFLARPGEWYDKLEYLYKHPEENKTIAKQARKYALKHYYGKEFLEEVEAAYDYFTR